MYFILSHNQTTSCGGKKEKIYKIKILRTKKKEAGQSQNEKELKRIIHSTLHVDKIYDASLHLTCIYQ